MSPPPTLIRVWCWLTRLILEATKRDLARLAAELTVPEGVVQALDMPLDLAAVEVGLGRAEHDPTFDVSRDHLFALPQGVNHHILDGFPVGRKLVQFFRLGQQRQVVHHFVNKFSQVSDFDRVQLVSPP